MKLGNDVITLIKNEWFRANYDDVVKEISYGFRHKFYTDNLGVHRHTFKKLYGSYKLVYKYNETENDNGFCSFITYSPLNKSNLYLEMKCSGIIIYFGKYYLKKRHYKNKIYTKSNKIYWRFPKCGEFATDLPILNVVNQHHGQYKHQYDDF